MAKTRSKTGTVAKVEKVVVGAARTAVKAVKKNVVKPVAKAMGMGTTARKSTAKKRTAKRK